MARGGGARGGIEKPLAERDACAIARVVAVPNLRRTAAGAVGAPHAAAALEYRVVDAERGEARAPPAHTHTQHLLDERGIDE